MAGNRERVGYYAANAIHIEPFEDTKVTCEELGARFLSPEEARAVPLEPIFDLLETDSGVHALPKFEKEYIILPGAYADHDYPGFEPFGSSLEEVLSGYVQSNFRPQKYVFYACWDYSYAIEFTEFSYRLLRCFSFGYANSSFFLFDASGENQIAFDDDICVTMIGRREAGADKKLILAGGDRLHWNSFFNREFVSQVVHYQVHVDFFNSHYQPRLPGIEVQRFARAGS